MSEAKLHDFTWAVKDEGDCGDHHCRGHVSYDVTCICGWTKNVPYKEESLMTQHRLDYLEAATSRLLGGEKITILAEA